jgi:hypothetical protein
MAPGAICSKLSLVSVVVDMTAKAIIGGIFKLFVGVAVPTVNLGMAALQEEGCLCVIENNLHPVIGCMASSTIGSELPVVRIVLTMAGVAILGSIFILSIRVTALACLNRMLALQRKFRLIVVIIHPSPGGGIVALDTISS